MKTKPKIALVCSAGGHLTEMLNLLDAFESAEIFFVTYDDPRGRDLKYKKYLTPRTGEKPLTLITKLPYFWSILRNEKPDIIISTGAELALPFLYLGRFYGAYTIYIESWCRVKTPSLSGRLVYPIVHEFLVQWVELLDVYGAKARYKGAVI